MNSTLLLTGRDREIVLAFVQQVRVFSQRQIADHWWHGELPNARKRLRRLGREDWMQRGEVQARPLPPLTSPLVTRRPPEPAPDFGEVAYRCRTRWRAAASRLCTIWIASERSAQRFGGVRRGELKNPLQATHDLGVAAVWLRLRKVAPAWAAAWRGEDVMAHTRRGQKIPDAFIVDHDQRILWVMEFAGTYDAQRIREFHQDCVARELAYQLW